VKQDRKEDRDIIVFGNDVQNNIRARARTHTYKI